MARELRVSRGRAYALVRTGELPAIKVGGRGVWRVERDRVEEWRRRRSELGLGPGVLVLLPDASGVADDAAPPAGLIAAGPTEQGAGDPLPVVEHLDGAPVVGHDYGIGGR